MKWHNSGLRCRDIARPAESLACFNATLGSNGQVGWFGAKNVKLFLREPLVTFLALPGSLAPLRSAGKWWFLFSSAAGKGERDLPGEVEGHFLNVDPFEARVASGPSSGPWSNPRHSQLFGSPH